MTFAMAQIYHHFGGFALCTRCKKKNHNNNSCYSVHYKTIVQTIYDVFYAKVDETGYWRLKKIYLDTDNLGFML